MRTDKRHRSLITRLAWGAVAGIGFAVFCVWAAALEALDRLRAWSER